MGGSGGAFANIDIRSMFCVAIRVAVGADEAQARRKTGIKSSAALPSKKHTTT